MAELELSEYKNNKNASIKKVLITIIEDYFLIFILMFLLFNIFYPTVVSNGYPKEVNEKLVEASKQINSYIKDTHLRSYDEKSQTLVNVNIDANQYLTNLIKTSAYVYNLNFPIKKSDGSYDKEHKVTIEETFLYNRENYEIDNLSYFYLKFKPNEPSIKDYIYNDVDYKDDLVTYQYLKVMQIEKINNYSSIFINQGSEIYQQYKNIVPIYLILNIDVAKNLIPKIVYNEQLNQDNETIFSNLLNSYLNGVQFGINELENKCSPYKSLMNNFNDSYGELAKIIIIVISITFVLSYVLLVVIMFIFSKKWISLGYKINKLSLINEDDSKPRYNLIFYHLLSCVLYSSSILIAFIFSGLLGVLSINLVGPINLMMILLIILGLDLFSIILILLTKKHVPLSCLLTKLEIKDTTSFLEAVKEKNNDQ